MWFSTLRNAMDAQPGGVDEVANKWASVASAAPMGMILGNPHDLGAARHIPNRNVLDKQGINRIGLLVWQRYSSSKMQF